MSVIPIILKKKKLGSGLNQINMSKVDYLANALNGVELQTDKGSGGSLKQLPCCNILTGTRLTGATDSLLMLDGNATYEFYLETILDTLPSSLTTLISTYSPTVKGWKLEVLNGGFYLNVRDTATENFNQAAGNYFKVGLNTIKITFNLPTKEITVNINDVIYTCTHSKANVFDVSGNLITIGDVAQKAVYYRLKKNGTVIHELILGDLVDTLGASVYRVYDLVESGIYLTFPYTNAKDYQDLCNPYKNGYDLYWIDDTLDYRGVMPKCALGTSVNPKYLYDFTGDIPLFKSVSANEIGYHIINYIELPDFPICDVTNRTYWKVSIESDPYYVGGTTGRERWFHQTWMNFTFIDTHIEDAFKGLFAFELESTKAFGQTAVVTKIRRLVVYNTASYYSKKDNSITSNIDLGRYYQSGPSRSTDGKILEVKAWSGDKVVGIEGDYLRYSADNGKTFNVGVDISVIDAVVLYCKILSNGNIAIFSDKTTVYYSDDNLTTITQSAVKNLSGTDYVFHTPVNPLYPGPYFATLNPIESVGNVYVFGNYNGDSASPTNLYYTKDYGATWIVFYTYGQNPAITDVGTKAAGTGGNPLGDPLNSLITNHVHGVSLGHDGKIYVATGDTNNTMMQCVYDSNEDSWVVTNLLDVAMQGCPRMRGIGCYEYNGYIYWGSDGAGTFTVNDVVYQARGIYKAPIATINDVTTHVCLYSTTLDCLNFVYDYESGNVIATFETKICLSDDHGETWHEFTNLNDSNFIPVQYNKAKSTYQGYTSNRVRLLPVS